MWIILKLIASLGAFLFRSLFAHFISLDKAIIDQIDETTLYIKSHKGKYGIYATSFVVKDLPCPAFKMTSENFLDRLFKKWGLAWEYQTGDHEFDKKIYIAADNPSLGRFLSLDVDFRKNILEIFANYKCKFIRSTGKHFIVQIKGDHTQEKQLRELTAKLGKIIKNFPNSSQTKLRDPFALKAVLTEAFIWSIATYAILSQPEWYIFNLEDVHLSKVDIVSLGLIWGLVAAAVLIAAIAFLFKGSSRGHRVLIESSLVLLLSLPAVGIGAASDVNTQMDESPTILETRKVINKITVRNTSRRRGPTESYFIYLAPSKTSQLQIPERIRVTLMDYENAHIPGTVHIRLGKGKLGIPWYRGFNFTTEIPVESEN